MSNVERAVGAEDASKPGDVVGSVRADRGAVGVMHVISLGAGVQSSTMALMAARGEITPMPECAIFADTGDEPASVYTWLDWLEKHLPFPVVRVQKGVLSADALKVRTSKSGNLYTKPSLPVFVLQPDGAQGMAQRHCTLDYKIVPIQREIRKRRQGRKVILWLGISRDEVSRMKMSQVPYIEHFYPLVDRRMVRAGCLEWMTAKQYPAPPRSACRYCPYHSDAEWLRLKESEPEDFEIAAVFDETLRAAIGGKVLTGQPYLHHTFKPLRDVDFAAIVDDRSRQFDMFNNECEGMCGV